MSTSMLEASAAVTTAYMLLDASDAFGTRPAIRCGSLEEARELAQRRCDQAYEHRLKFNYVPGDEYRPRPRIPSNWNGSPFEYDLGAHLACVAEAVAVEQDEFDHLPA